jgi:hypothetical protein
LCGGDTSRHLEVHRATYRLTDVARHAIGSDDTEPDARHDADPGSTGTVVEPVKSAKDSQLVADVEVVHPDAEARFGQRAGRVEERSGGIEQQLHVGQRFLHCSCIVGVHNPVGQAETSGKCGDLWPVPAGHDGVVTAVNGVLRNQGARVTVGPIEHP